MRIAVASNGLDVSTHGGRCTDYTCYTVTRGVIAQCQNFPNPCLPPAATASLLNRLGVDVLIAHTLDPSIQSALEQSGVETVTGAIGTARSAAEEFLADMLAGRGSFEPDLAADRS
ncbi:MAG TPA: dinitrogenase iron-molybdenum cofactor biosynthesis protein [Candidatus Rubneribacter avistercoris]|nr:dinitrogenase iron-molybdenum cofactor biosynthesis protein [Candidatus Rubneribacter avistercoris]